jgi:hypothetical protein
MKKFITISSLLLIVYVVYNIHSTIKEEEIRHKELMENYISYEEREEIKKQEEEQEKIKFEKEIEEVKNIMPYEGMKGELVPYTILGNESYTIEEISDNCYYDGYNYNNMLGTCEGKIYTFTVKKEVEENKFYEYYTYEVIVKVWKNEVEDVWVKNDVDDITIY